MAAVNGAGTGNATSNMTQSPSSSEKFVEVITKRIHFDLIALHEHSKRN